jgi:DinB family protein
MVQTKADAVAALRRAIDELLAVLAGVPEAEWASKPASDVWSLAETAEHVVKTNQRVQTTLATRLRPIPAGSRCIEDAAIPALFEHEGAAPDVARPTGEWPERDRCLAMLAGSRDALVAWAERGPDDPRTQAAVHPFLGLMDGVQWLLFVAAHTARHTRDVRVAAGH